MHLMGLPLIHLPAFKSFLKSIQYSSSLHISLITTLIGCPSYVGCAGAGGVLIIPFVYGIRLRLLLILLFLFVACLPH